MWTAAFWGLFAGGALLVGAVVALVMPIRLKAIGMIMGFGAGVLISAVAFELTAEAIDTAGLAIVTTSLVFGALVYLAGDWAVSNAGGHRRKSPLHGGTYPHLHLVHLAARATFRVQRSAGERRSATLAAPTPAEPAEPPANPAAPAAVATSGGALVIGALLDGIPESAAIGMSLLDGTGVGLAFVAAVFLSNVPESMAATTGLKASGRSTKSILLLWISVALVSAVAAALGFAFLGQAGPALHGGIQAFAAGAVLAMLATTMLPEAVEHAGRFVGLVTVLGFAAAVLLGEL